MKILSTILFCCLVMLIATHVQAQQYQWAKKFGGKKNDIGRTIKTDSLGNIYMMGTFSDTTDFDPGTGVLQLIPEGISDIFISKFDASGNFIWAKQIGGISAETPGSMAVDDLGNVYTTGSFTLGADFDPGPNKFELYSINGAVFTSKLDANGNFVWAKSTGGNATVFGKSISVDKTGNVYVTGEFSSTVDFDLGSSEFTMNSIDGNVFFLKLDTAGNFTWAKQIGGTQKITIVSMDIDGAGNIYSNGIFKGTADFSPGEGIFSMSSTTSNDPSMFILKMDNTGSLLWAKRTEGSAIYNMDVGELPLSTDNSGNVYLSGKFTGNADFDPGAGAFYLISNTQPIFVLKLDSSGNFKWAKQMGGHNSLDIGKSLVVDASHNVYTIGTFHGNGDFDPGPGTFYLNSEVANDVFISKLDSSGNFKSALQLGGNYADYGFSITIDKSDNLFCTGFFRGVVDFDLGNEINYLYSAGEMDVFIMKLIQAPNDVHEAEENASSFYVYPNPGSSAVTLHFGKQLTNGTLKLINTLGQTILQQSEITTESSNIDVAGIAKGVYFVEVNDGGSISRMKFVKD